MIKRVPFFLLLIGILQALSTSLVALGLYFFLYPSFFAFSFPDNPSLNLLWLFLMSPFIFECLLVQQGLLLKTEETLELFRIQLFFEILIKSLYIFVSLFTVESLSLTQVRLFYVFLVCLLLDGLRAYLLVFFKKRSFQ